MDVGRRKEWQEGGEWRGIRGEIWFVGKTKEARKEKGSSKQRKRWL